MTKGTDSQMSNQSALILYQPSQVIYFSCVGFSPMGAGWYLAEVQTAFKGPTLVTSFDSEGESEYSHFNTLYDCDALVILPRRYYLGEMAMWEAKVMFALKRNVLVFTPENSMRKVDTLEDLGLHINSKVKYRKEVK